MRTSTPIPLLTIEEQEEKSAITAYRECIKPFFTDEEEITTKIYLNLIPVIKELLKLIPAEDYKKIFEHAGKRYGNRPDLFFGFEIYRKTKAMMRQQSLPFIITENNKFDTLRNFLNQPLCNDDGASQNFYIVAEFLGFDPKLVYEYPLANTFVQLFKEALGSNSPKAAEEMKEFNHHRKSSM